MIIRCGGDASSLGAFLQQCSREDPAWEKLTRGVVTDASELEAVVQELHRLVKSTGAARRLHNGSHEAVTGAKPKDNNGYSRKTTTAISIVLVCGSCSLFCSASAPCRWAGGKWGWTLLRAVSVDSGGFLEEIPEHWTARELSEFLFGRGDLAVLASMWTCLFHDVGGSARDRKHHGALRYLREAREGGFANASEKYMAEHGVAPVPAFVYKER